MFSLPVTVLASLFVAPLFIGATGVCIAGRTRMQGTPGLLFHGINAAQPTISSLSPSHFRSIIRRLHSAGWHGTTLAQANISSAKPNVVLTFDDGCNSVIAHALPVLKEFGYTATLFPVAGYLGKRSSWDVLPPFTHMTATEIRFASESGHEIGSHTLTHADLTFLDEKHLRMELKDSKQVLEDIISRPVTSLSFPFGSWNKRVWETAQETGYIRATIYRGHRYRSETLLPVYGVYRFDTPFSVLSRIHENNGLSLSRCIAACMSNFARGAPLWKFRNTYMAGRSF